MNLKEKALAEAREFVADCEASMCCREDRCDECVRRQKIADVILKTAREFGLRVAAETIVRIKIEDVGYERCAVDISAAIAAAEAAS